MPLCYKNVAQEGGGRILEVGLFSRDYSIYNYYDLSECF